MQRGWGGFGGVVAFLDTETALYFALYNDDGHRIDKCDRMILGYQPEDNQRGSLSQDWLIWEESPYPCKKATRVVVKTLKKGFLVNLQKSRLTPHATFQWLGVSWDTWRMVRSLPLDKRKNIRKFAISQFISRRHLERVHLFGLPPSYTQWGRQP